MIASRLKRRLITLLTAPALALASFTAVAFTTATPAHACGTIPISSPQNVWLGSSPGVNIATVQLWYNGCTPGNRYTYATMAYDQNPSTNSDFTLWVTVEDQDGAYPYGWTEVIGHVDYGGNCTSGCVAVAHGVNIDNYPAPKKFRGLAVFQWGRATGCQTWIATDWWQFSYGHDEYNGVSGGQC